MRIGELAQRTRVSARALRHYERLGLLEPSRGPQGYREYSPDDENRVAAIRALMEAGVALSTIAEFMGSSDGTVVRPCPRALDACRETLMRIDTAIAKLSDMRRVLSEALLWQERL